jgi:integrase
MKTILLKLLLRTDFNAVSGKYPVYLRAHYNKVQYRIKLPVLVQSEFWQVKRQRVSDKSPDNFHINGLLDFYEAKARDYIWRLYTQQKPFSVEDLKAALFGQICQDDFFTFAAAETDADTSLSTTTRRTYHARLSKLRSFRPKLQISEINYDFLMSYRNYLIKLGNEESTWNKDFSIIKSFLNRAKQKGLIETHDFNRIKIKAVEGKREFLTQPELLRLRELYKNSQLTKSQRNALQQFLFSCYTGLRYQDLLNLTWCNIVDGFIVITMHKTKKPVRIPLIPEAVNLLPAKGNDADKVLNVYCNQALNRRLKEVVTMANIHKHISHHCARHTFATLAVANGIPIEVVSKLLGHTSTKVTTLYVKILEGQKVVAMDKYNTMLQNLGS